MTDRNEHWSDLLRRANRGDGAAYGRFLQQVTPVIRNIARARLAHGTAEEVEDITQEALLALHAKRHTWREDSPVTPWLYAIARYKTADAARRRGNATVPIDDLADILPDDGIGEVTAARDLGQLLGGIDDRSAGIVRALGVEGESAGEVGNRLGMSEGAVRVAYHRALQKLRRQAGAETAAMPSRPYAAGSEDAGTKQTRPQQVGTKDARTKEESE